MDKMLLSNLRSGTRCLAPVCVLKDSGYVLDTLTCQSLSKHARCIEKESPYVLICLGQFPLKSALTNGPIFGSVVGYISHI